MQDSYLLFIVYVLVKHIQRNLFFIHLDLQEVLIVFDLWVFNKD